MITHNMRKDPQYLTLPQVARQLGLGLRKQNRTNPKYSVGPDEKLARPVRKLIHDGKLKAVYDSGTYLVREDWVQEYEALREVKAKWPK